MDDFGSLIKYGLAPIAECWVSSCDFDVCVLDATHGYLENVRINFLFNHLGIGPSFSLMLHGRLVAPTKNCVGNLAEKASLLWSLLLLWDLRRLWRSSFFLSHLFHGWWWHCIFNGHCSVLRLRHSWATKSLHSLLRLLLNLLLLHLHLRGSCHHWLILHKISFFV